MGLNDEEVKKQIDHMMAFIHQEAKEKAEEIDAKAEEEFNIEKGRLVQQERLKIMALYEKKEKQIDLQRKIDRSNYLNVARLRLLETQNQYIQEILEDARSQLGKVTKDKNHYQKVLTGLLTQSLFQLLEPVAQIRCREADVELIKVAKEESLKAYYENTKKSCELSIDMQHFLSPECAGGLELLAKEGRIKVTNTLESRLELLSRQMLPEIRETLFGKSSTRKFFD
ncbi:V-type proton ATPase subunit E [Hydra vulgaris]|uniref:V-type proton ATPase subunit E 1 n=1 Tax=Hydra vulgaris TaxID=6087 RepID=T2MG21_HYDVU|nr:V-type proton ATPase subunit E [Hydra vulgaris]XP_047125779.1 V-type proton ATPase subunit E [Hydra vulgaris]XP_047125780.1 V-type proton ATPase subunit E [Hydra vulgaris]